MDMANNNSKENFKKILDGSSFIYVDIGSRGGLSPEWEKVRELITVVLFEPDAKEAKRLEESSLKSEKIIPKAIWTHKGKIKFHVTRNPSYSSVLVPDKKVLDGSYYFCRNFYDIDKILDIEVDSLEQILNEHKIVEIDFIKIDIQGAENLIFNSIKNWNHTIGIHTEAYGEKLYKSGSDIAETLTSLYDRNFRLYDLKIIAESPIVEVDNVKMFSKELLNARPKSGYRSRPMVYDLLLLKDKLEILSSSNKNQIRKMIFILCVYKYFDYAISLLVKSYNQSVFNDLEMKITLECIVNLHKQNLTTLQSIKENLRSPKYNLKER